MGITRPGLALLLTALWLLAGCGTDEAGAPGAEPRQASPRLPDGWRWESYRDVELAVPADWGYDNGSQRLGQWCLWHPGTLDTEQPMVGRPGPITEAACREPTGSKPHPATLVENLGTFVALEDRNPAADPGESTEGDRTTVTTDTATVVVQAESSLRRRILATLHTITVDRNGCPTTHPVSRHPERRPEPARDVTTLTGVREVSACRYSVDAEPTVRDAPTLMSSLRLQGEPAQRAIVAVAASPVGGGSNYRCAPEVEYQYGTEVVVLDVTSDQGRSTLYLWYSGCAHNGFDDGVSVRTLTRQAFPAPFMAGPNTLVNGYTWPRVEDDVARPEK